MKYNTIILVDDNPTTIFYHKDVVSEFEPSAEIFSFDNPYKFIDEFKQTFSKSTEPILLLLDINMPEIRGFELIELLEENEEDMSKLDILIVTSSKLNSDLEKASRYPNIIGFIEKPIDIDKLNKALTGIN